ncbi:MAG: type III-A CRISPR-associated protein Cas10/Csm1 [Methanobacterium sp.]|jgi:CRISPR-associated protein Csm1
MNLKELQFAALLHDIGKFSQRAGNTPHKKYKTLSEEDYGLTGAHSKWSATFMSKFDFDIMIEDLVLHHHRPDKSKYPEIAKILQKADHHSSKERSKSSRKHEVKKEPLISVFSKVKIDENNQPSEYYLPLRELNIDNFDEIKPQATKKEIMAGWNLQPDYKKLWELFEKEIESLTNKDDFNTIYYLLRKYTSLMPSAAYVDHPDISLFDHLKTTSALATCLFYYTQEKEFKYSDREDAYLVVNGDISGIQKFIYKISSPQEAQKGMSKRLRGRSFYLNLINDAIVNRIINDLKLTPANILFCGGGHFILILPNTQKSKNVLSEVSTEINSIFIEKFNAELYLAISNKSCAGEDLEDFGSIMDDLAFENLKNKRSRFKEVLGDLFKNENQTPYQTCPVCGSGYKSSELFCDECLKHETLGRKIANTDYIIRVISPENKMDFQELGVGYYFEHKGNHLINKLKELAIKYEKIDVLRLNSSDYLNLAEELDEYNNISYGFTFMGNTVPQHPLKGTLYFSHLAEISKGTDKMGILKMDVDNLGKIFSKGLENPSISRVSTLSSFMDLFFSGYINHIAEKYRVLEDICPSCQDNVALDKIKLSFGEEESIVEVYREKEGKVCSECEKSAISTIYITYSGGDDLLVFGPYDHIIEFASELRREFKEWTCQNRDISISAGVFLAGPKFPAERGVKFANNSLSVSKDCGKDMITLFNETVRWETQEPYKGFKDLLYFAYKLENLSGSKKISKSLIYSMLMMWQDTFTPFKPANNIKEWNKNNKIRLEKKRYVPLFKYKLRTVKNLQIKEEMNREGLKFMPWIKIPASWVSLRTR